MKIRSLLIALFLFCSAFAVAQKVIRHKVKSGESIYAIAKKYDVSEQEIYENNPKLKGTVLSLNAEVRIPNKNYKPADKTKPVKKQPVATDETLPSHLVLAKETLYSISKRYGMTIEALEKLNPELKNGGLKAGMVLQLATGFEEKPFIKEERIQESEKLAKAGQPQSATKTEEIQPKADIKPALPVENKQEVITAAPEGTVIHKVQPKETLFRISKKYHVSVDELKKRNPEVAAGLPVGYDLVISNASAKATQSTTGDIIETPIEKKPVTFADETSGVVNVSPQTFENLSKADFLIAKASENLGTRYRSGGTTAAGFDCSGLMFSTFKNIDMTLPRSSYDMARSAGFKIDRCQAQKGDLIFFATFGGGRVSHVGMVTEVHDDEIKFIHSSTQAGVIISSTKENYYSRTFVQVNRVLTQ